MALLYFMRWQIYPALLLFAFLLSCIDQSDYELDEIELNPSLALPLVKGDLTIRDFLSDKDSAHIKIYPDGLIYLAYEQELKNQGIEELFVMPEKLVNKSFILPAATLPGINVDVRSDSIIQEVDLGLSPELLNEIALKSGQLTFSTSVVPSSSQLNYEIRVSLPDFVSRTTNQPLNLTARGTGSVDLSNYTMFINNNKFDLKLVLVIKQHTNPVVITGGTSVNIQLNFRSMDFKYIKGYFGFQTVALPAENIELGAFDNAFEDADVSLAQPKINLTVSNDYGVLCKVDFKNLEARKTGASLAVILNPANPITLAAPATLGTSATTTVAIANVKEVLDFAPSEFYYQAEARINDGVSSGNNFLADTSKLRIKMNFEVPLYGHASNILVRDTVDVDWSDVDQSQIEKAALKLKLTNQLPLDGAVQFFLTDKNFVVIGTLLTDAQTNVIKGSTVNASGDLQTAGLFDDSIDLEKSKIDKVFEAKHIIIVANLSTSRNASGSFPDVKFKADYSLSIEAGILANLKLNVKL
jgi:hypothetical protein